MIPVNIAELFHNALRDDRRPPDGLLHASGDLVGSLRHAMLAVAGAPRVTSEIVSDIRLMTGTMWHRWAGEQLVRKGVLFMQEIRLDRWLPEGWSGTADWLFWDSEARGFVLGDLKTIKGEGIKWIDRDGAKLEHLWQLSAYWHALYRAGLPMVKGFGVLYWPMNDTPDKEELVEPLVMECDPLPYETVWGEMEARWELTQRYLDSLLEEGPAYGNAGYLTDALAPEMDRVQKVFWDGKQEVFNLKLVPHWSAQFCPYPNELCSCNEQGTTKIGHYTLDEEYVPRDGYEEIEPAVRPSPKDFAKRRKHETLAGAAEDMAKLLADSIKESKGHDPGCLLDENHVGECAV